MSTLLVDELLDGVVFSQKIRINRPINIQHIRPWIFKKGLPSTGVFTCDVKQGSTLLKSSTITLTDLATISNTYTHGYIRFDFDNLFLTVSEGQTYQEYTIEFYMDSYTNESNYIAIVRDYDDPLYVRYGSVDIDNNPLNDCIQSCGFEIFVQGVI